MTTKSNEYSYVKKDSKEGQIILEVSISTDRFVSHKSKILRKKAQSVKLPGFRPGKAPENMVEAYLGEELFKDTLNDLLPQITVEILKEEKLEPITHVEYKLHEDKEKIRFDASFVPFPVISLKGLNKVKVKKEDPSVTEKEIDDTITDMVARSVAKEKKDTKDDQKKPEKVAKKPDDAWAKSLGIGVGSLKEAREIVKKELIHQKKQLSEQKYVNDLVKLSVEKLKIVAPITIVEHELKHRDTDYRSRIENLGIKFEDFIRNQKVSMEDLQKKWKEEAETKVRGELLLAQIAREYNVSVSEDEIDRETQAVTSPEAKKTYETASGRDYIRNVLAQQKALKKLIEIVEGNK